MLRQWRVKSPAVDLTNHRSPSSPSPCCSHRSQTYARPMSFGQQATAYLHKGEGSRKSCLIFKSPSPQSGERILGEGYKLCQVNQRESLVSASVSRIILIVPTAFLRIFRQIFRISSFAALYLITKPAGA